MYYNPLLRQYFLIYITLRFKAYINVFKASPPNILMYMVTIYLITCQYSDIHSNTFSVLILILQKSANSLLLKHRGMPCSFVFASMSTAEEKGRW